MVPNESRRAPMMSGTKFPSPVGKRRMGNAQPDTITH